MVAATDYMRLSADQIGLYVRDHYKVLGTDRFGRSDCRQKLCHLFEMERHLVGV
jgi:pyruvate dehydrogenase E1 component